MREIEAWLMAGSESLANFLGVGRSRIPAEPETENRPKETMVNLARRSRYRAIREDMVPREARGRSIGPAYPSRLIEFIERRWRPEVAAERADSLHRAMTCLTRLTRPDDAPR